LGARFINQKIKTIMFLRNKKITLATAVFAVAMLFTACKEDKKENTPAADTDAAAETMKTSTPADTSGDIAVNPPHGQPGHRCEIPVGAPLDTPARTESNTIQTQTKGNTTSPVIKSSNSGDSNAKVNPPHGQPGHRCEIPVGAPLE
jgi:hypothetical protein